MQDPTTKAGGYLFAATAGFGTIFYWGTKIQSGEHLSSWRSRFDWRSDLLNGWADTYGSDVVGVCLMGLAVFGWCFVAFITWRNLIR